MEWLWKLGICHISIGIVHSMTINSTLFENTSNNLVKFTPEELMKRDIVGLPLNGSDFEKTQDIEQLEPVFQTDPIELAGMYEGDIYIFNEAEREILMSPIAPSDIINSGNLRNAIVSPLQKWPDATVPYLISSVFNTIERRTIASAFQRIQNETCIKFIPRQSEKNYIHIIKGDGCSSSVGRIGNAQHVSIGNGCVYFGIVMHELYHALGFWHEQSRADRDNYITIVWSNIQNGMEFNFKKQNWGTIQSLDTSYDLDSIMHYGDRAFAKDYSKPTIIPNQPAEIGQRKYLSPNDVLKLNRLYECDKNTGSTNRPVTTSRPITSVTTGSGSCTDDNSLCSAWASRGECERNSVWMNINCKKSCKICSECEDKHSLCEKWSRQGECEKNANWMKPNCKKSCNTCEGSCSDNNHKCSLWAQSGYCVTYKTYMEKQCKKSCGLCLGGSIPETTTTTTTTTTRRPKCVDSHHYCSAWESRNQCKENPLWMHVNCKKSCKKC